jgi:hypothetical protein
LQSSLWRSYSPLRPLSRPHSRQEVMVAAEVTAVADMLAAEASTAVLTSGLRMVAHTSAGVAWALA